MGSITKNRTSPQALLLPTFLIHTTVPMPLSLKKLQYTCFLLFFLLIVQLEEPVWIKKGSLAVAKKSEETEYVRPESSYSEPKSWGSSNGNNFGQHIYGKLQPMPTAWHITLWSQSMVYNVMITVQWRPVETFIWAGLGRVTREDTPNPTGLLWFSSHVSEEAPTILKQACWMCPCVLLGRLPSFLIRSSVSWGPASSSMT